MRTSLKIVIVLIIQFSGFAFGQINDTISNDSATTNENFKSYKNWAGKYRSRSYFANGKIRHKSNCNLVNVLKSKEWDNEGRLVQKSRQFPWRSTSYTIIIREKTYNEKGRLVKYELTKKKVACFGGRDICTVIKTFDGNRKRISKERISRKANRKKRRQQQENIRSKFAE